MVTRKLDAIVAEFDALQEPGPWGLALWVWGDDDRSTFVAMCMWFALSAALDFLERFSDLRRFPCQLMWLVEEVPGTPCQHRARVARRLLEGDDNGDSTSRRVNSVLKQT